MDSRDSRYRPARDEVICEDTDCPLNEAAGVGFHVLDDHEHTCGPTPHLFTGQCTSCAEAMATA